MNEMAAVIENYCESEVCTVFKVLQPEGMNQNEVHRRLVSVWDKVLQQVRNNRQSLYVKNGIKKL
jgi:hypothetical protein